MLTQNIESKMNTTRAFIENVCVKKMSETGVRKTDELDNLVCFCSDNPPNNFEESQIRGCVFDGDKLIFKSLGYPFDIKGEYLPQLPIVTSVCTPIYEGTIIRMFYHGGKWYTTTHRKLDASRSKWGNEVSFGELFAQTVENVLNIGVDELKANHLDTNFGYIFLIGTTEITRIVSPAKSRLMLLSLIDENQNDIIYTNPDKIPKILTGVVSKKLQFDNLREVKNFVDDLLYPFDSEIGVHIQIGDISFKIMNEHYVELSLLRQNLPSIMFAYLHNVFDENKQRKFRNLYPKFEREFDFYDKEISDICKDLYYKYLKKYVPTYKVTTINDNNDTISSFTENEKNILKEIHNVYLETRNIITKNDILPIIKNLKISMLNKIISDRRRAKRLSEIETSSQSS